MSRVLRVSTSGYYEWRRRRALARAVADELLTEQVKGGARPLSPDLRLPAGDRRAAVDGQGRASAVTGSLA